MTRSRTLAIAALVAIPVAAGAFVVQERASLNGARLFDQVMAIVNDRADRDSFREELISMIKTMDSRNAARADAFMSNTLRVDHDNILLVHRMDTVEGRVAALERRTP